MIDFKKLQEINEQKANDEVQTKRHNELLLDNTKTQEVFVKSISALVQFLDNKVTKTEVVNQLKEVSTPDVYKVVNALDSLHDTLKTHENTDLSEVTNLLSSLVDEAKQIPKEIPTQEKIELKDYSKHFTSLETAIKTIEKAIKAQDLKVEAPIVNVPETTVNVEAPDLKPLETSIGSGSKDVVKAVKGIKIPELNTDPIEKLLKKTNKLLGELPDLMPTGGSGGGRVSPYEDSNGVPSFVQLTVDGKIPVEAGSTSTYEPAYDVLTDTNLVYLGKGVLGSAETDPTWQIKRLDKTTGRTTFADREATFTKVWDDRTTYAY